MKYNKKTMFSRIPQFFQSQNKHAQEVVIRCLRWIFGCVFLFLGVFIVPTALAEDCGDHVGGTFNSGGARVECACDDTIVTDYVFEDDLTCPNNGLNIAQSLSYLPINNFTIDCQDHIISGSKAQNSKAFAVGDTDSKCKLGDGCQDIVIKNCRIENFNYGIWLGDNTLGKYRVSNWDIYNNDFYNVGIGIYANHPSPYQSPMKKMNIHWNDFLEMDTSNTYTTNSAGIYFINSKLEELTIKDNRITSFADTKDIWGIYLDAPYESNPATQFSIIENNFIRAFKSTGEGVDLYILRKPNTELYIKKNVFSGEKSSVSGSGGSIEWYCDSESENIFKARLLSNYIRPDEVDASCSKECLDMTEFINYGGSIGTTMKITENSCMYSSFSNTFDLSDATKYGIYIDSSNVILDCSASYINGDSVNDATSRNNNNRIGIFADSKSRVTLNDCSLYNFNEGIQLKNSEDFLLRSNYFNASPFGSGMYMKTYFLNIVSDPFNTQHYNHQIFNPANTMELRAYNYLWYGGASTEYGVFVHYFNRNNNIFDGDNINFYTGGPVSYNVGHFTLANSADVEVRDIDIHDGDPFTFAKIKAISRPCVPPKTGACSIIFNNNATNNYVGFKVRESENVEFIGNSASSNKKGSSGGIFHKLKTSLIGADGTRESISMQNNFSNNVVFGLYYGGYYDGSSDINDPQIYEWNTVNFNTISDNKGIGLMVNGAAVSKFENNIIVNNGAGDIAGCASATNPEQGCSPGFYITQAFNNIIKDNNISDNSGNNLSIDSSVLAILDDSGNYVCQGNPAPTLENIFIGNTISRSKKQSGVFIDSNTCQSYDPDYLPDDWLNYPGKVEKNYFGYFYIKSGDYTNPNLETGFIGPQNPSDLGSLPLSGNNVINENMLDGITISWHVPELTKIKDNVFYDNDIGYVLGQSQKGNKRYGVYFQGSENAQVLKWNNIIGNIINGDILGGPNQVGVNLISAPGTRVFGNKIYQDQIGIKIERVENPADGDWVEVGYFFTYGSLNYKNEIYDFSNYGIKGIYADKAQIKENSIYNTSSISPYYPVGIAIMGSTNWTLDSNKIYDLRDYRGRYLYVGPERTFSNTDFGNFYPYPNDLIRSYYQHTIQNTNWAGPDIATYKAVYYFVDKTTYNPGDITETYHLQVVSGSNFAFNNTFTFNGADPIEFDFYKPSAGSLGTIGGTSESNRITLRDCRGDCLLLYNVSGPSTSAGDLVPIAYFSIKNTSRSGIKGFYIKNSRFENLNIGKIDTDNGVNLDSIEENGGLYLYNSGDNNGNNTIKTNTIIYQGNGPTNKRWDLFLASEAKNNKFESNTFGSASYKAAGAFEMRSGLSDKDYNTANSLEMANDKYCRLENDGKCDPNCTDYQLDNFDNVDCPDTRPSPICTNAANDCCLDAFDGTLDTDCPPGVDPDGLGATISTAIDDGICSKTTGRTNCDPNCTVNADLNCYYRNPACTSSSGDCCISDSTDGTCDYDCPRGLDPDCIAKDNIWCTAINTFNLQDGAPNLYLPNYFESAPEPDISGGGGIPNGAYFCYSPHARFKPSTPPAQMTIDRKANLTNRNLRKYYFDINTSDFIDLRGLNLVARILVSNNGTDFAENKWSDFVVGSVSLINDPVGQSIPTIDNTKEYALGEGANPLRTKNFQMSDYPTLAVRWGDPYRTSLRETWYSYNNLISSNPPPSPCEAMTFSAGKESTATCKPIAKIKIKNSKGYYGETGDGDSGEENLSFDFDFKNPAVTDWLLEQTNINITNYPHVYKLRWAAPVTETNWTNGSAHYEIWFAENQPEATAKSGPSVGLWDDLTYSARSGSALPYQNAASCPGAAINCYDPDLAYINCNGLVSGKCETIVKVYPKTGSLTGSPTTYEFQDGVLPNGGYNGTIDVNIKQNGPATNYNSNTWNCVDYNGDGCQAPASGIHRVLMKWDTSTIPSSCVVTSASITINNNIANGDTNVRFGVYGLRRNWGEATATWNKYDGTNNWTTAGANDTTNDRYSIDLMDGNGDGGWGRGLPMGTLIFNFDNDGQVLIQNWIDGTINNYGIIIKDHDGADTNAFIWWTQENGTPSNRPKLSITCAENGGDSSYSTINFNICAVDNFGNYICSGAQTLKPWVETRYGNIYSKENVGTDFWDPYEQKVSTFLLRSSGGTINSYWASVCDPTNPTISGTHEGLDVEKCTQTGSDFEMNFPEKSNKYTIANLGSLDFLNKPINGAPNYGYQDFNQVVSDLKSRYGAHRVMQIAAANLSTTPNDWSLGKLLEGKIYYRNGDLTIVSGESIEFKKGTGFQNASGLIIVNGKLTINANISYESGFASDKLINIPSAAWIVMGDITIDPAVTNISGAFIALGKPGNTSGADIGTVNTGTEGDDDGGGQKDTKLTVNGLLFARRFKFIRNIASQTEGSEIIIYDGRLQANPPLGLEDFAKNLPVWK